MDELSILLERARTLSWAHFGKRITFYLPGMIRYEDERGRYPAISLTGEQCVLNCDHCGGLLLRSMIAATTPQALVDQCLRLEQRGDVGCLLTGGSRRDGTLPWLRFVEAIAEVKQRTKLTVSIHTGLIDNETARRLKEAGVDQALIDVIGSDQTLREVYHLDQSVDAIRRSLHALSAAGMDLVPHIVVGLHYGRIVGEYAALEMIREVVDGVDALVFVSLMPLRGTPMWDAPSPPPEEVGRLIATARVQMPTTVISLGCARSRGKEGWRIEEYAIDAGVNRMAIKSDRAIERARVHGLEIDYRYTCCSVCGMC